MKGENRWMIILIAAIIVLGGAIYYIFYNGGGPSEFRKGIEVNKETFINLLSDADKVYIVMDIIGVDDDYTRRNILQCGIDFAGSMGLANRDVTYVSMSDSGCTVASLSGLNETTTVKNCIDMVNRDGISLYVLEGNETKYYTRAAMVGVGDLYVLGTCNVGVAE
jgi:hypothetical protein